MGGTARGGGGAGRAGSRRPAERLLDAGYGGAAAAGTVVVAVLIAVTLVPALLGICGRRIGPARPRRRGKDKEGPPRPSMGVRWARFVVKRPVAVLLGGVALLGVIAVPAASLKMGLPGDDSKPVSTTQRRAYDLVAEGFGPGFNGPLTAVVQADDGGSAQAAAKSVAKQIDGRKDVAAVGQPQLSKSGDTAVVTIVPAASPAGSETADLVHALRARRSRAGAMPACWSPVRRR